MSGSVASGAYSGPPTINGITEVDADVLVITEGGSLSYPDYPNTVLVVETDGTVVGVSEIDESQVPTTLRSTTFPSVVVVGGVSAASATVGSLTVTGVATIGTLSTTSLALSGTLSVAGATTLAACSVSSLACSGAATIQGFTTVNDDLLVTGDVGARDGYFMTVQADDFIAGNNSSLAITSVTTFTATGPATMAAITCTGLTTSGQIFSNYSAASQMVFTPGTAASTFLRVEGPAGGVNRRITFPDPGAADREVLYTNKAQPATLGSTTFSGGAVQVQIPGDGTASATQELWFGLDAAGETQWRLLGANSTFGSNWRVRSRLGGVTSDKLIVAASGTSIWSNLSVGKAPTANALDVLGATVLQGLTCTTLTTSSDGVIGGNLSVTGTVTFAAVTVASFNCTGNAVVGGTLGVTGDCSTSGTFLGSAVDVAGNADVGADLTVSGATTLTSALMTSLICTGTASVTGNATLSANVGIGAAPNASYRLYATGNPTNLTRSAVVPTFSVRVLNVSDNNTVAWSQNGDPTDSGRIMQVYNGATSTSAGIQSVLGFHIIGGGTASRVLNDLKVIRETNTQGNSAFVLTGRTSAASIVMRDYAYLGWSKAYISPGAGNPVTLASQTAPTAGYYVAMGTAGGTTDGHTEVNGNLLVRGTTTISGAITLAAITCSSLTCSGNATVGGTLGVTGVTTLSSTLGVAGQMTYGLTSSNECTASSISTYSMTTANEYIRIYIDEPGSGFTSGAPYLLDIVIGLTCVYLEAGTYTNLGSRDIRATTQLTPYYRTAGPVGVINTWECGRQGTSSSPNTTDNGTAPFNNSAGWGNVGYIAGSPNRIFVSIFCGLNAAFTYSVRAHVRCTSETGKVGQLTVQVVNA
jgi:fibronectin-binding autotransporter adhesin